MKLYNLGKPSDYNWIKDATLCNSIEESDIIYYSDDKPPYINSDNCLHKLTPHDKSILNIYNQYLNKKIIIGVKYGGLLLNHIYNGLVYSVGLCTKLAKPTRCEEETCYLCENYGWHSYYANYIDFRLEIKIGTDITFYYSYIPKNRRSVIITFDPSITNRVPNSKVMSYLNHQIISLYGKN